jgi:dynein heavy chain
MKNAMEKCYNDNINGLKELIIMVQGKLEKPVRMKIMCLITMDAHSRDIVEQLSVEGVKKADEF